MVVKTLHLLFLLLELILMAFLQEQPWCSVVFSQKYSPFQIPSLPIDPTGFLDEAGTSVQALQLRERERWLLHLKNRDDLQLTKPEALYFQFFSEFAHSILRTRVSDDSEVKALELTTKNENYPGKQAWFMEDPGERRIPGSGPVITTPPSTCS